MAGGRSTQQTVFSVFASMVANVAMCNGANLICVAGGRKDSRGCMMGNVSWKS